MVSVLAHEQAIFGTEGHCVRELELPDLGTLLTEDGNDFGFAFSPIDDLDPMVARVGHPQESLFVDGQRLWAAELQGCISVLSHAIDIIRFERRPMELTEEVLDKAFHSNFVSADEDE